VLAAAWGADPHMGIGFLGVSLAFGLTVVSMAAAIGHISGCHLNPAVTAGLVASGRLPAKELPGYWIAQVVGGILGAGLLFLVARGLENFDPAAGFASNGYGEQSPGGYPWQSCFIIEAVLTAVFVFVIHGATANKAGGTMFGAIADIAGPTKTRATPCSAANVKSMGRVSRSLAVT
jgi:aquaporin Z